GLRLGLFRFMGGEDLLVSLHLLGTADGPDIVGRAAAIVVDAVQESQHPVIILLGNRIDLVIVAAGTIERHAPHGLADHGDDVIQAVVAGLFGIDRLVIPDAEAIKARGNQGIVIARIKLITRQLFAQEAIERLVVVESANDIIAVAPDVWLGIVALVAVGVG